MAFRRYIGIDYSGAQTANRRLPQLQVYMAEANRPPQKVPAPAAPRGRKPYWNRSDIADWLIDQVRQDRPFIAGIDHAFSLPISYMRRFRLKTWGEFLDDFCGHWPTHRPDSTVEQFRHGNRRTGRSDEFRLTERWTSSAKSVFLFDVQGSVAKSTHAGIPWLRHIRREAGRRVHFWPFDGWAVPPDRSVIAEVYPSIFRRRYPVDGRTPDERDAHSVARWLVESDRGSFLARYFMPPLTRLERALARLEGWILGVT